MHEIACMFFKNFPKVTPRTPFWCCCKNRAPPLQNLGCAPESDAFIFFETPAATIQVRRPWSIENCLNTCLFSWRINDVSFDAQHADCHFTAATLEKGIIDYMCMQKCRHFQAGWYISRLIYQSDVTAKMRSQLTHCSTHGLSIGILRSDLETFYRSRSKSCTFQMWISHNR